jgi:hypothetical protein
MAQSRAHARRLTDLVQARIGWLDGLLLGGFALAVLVLGLLFFTVFLALFSVLALIGWARLRWSRRRVKRAASPRVIEGEYTVVRRDDLR